MNKTIFQDGDKVKVFGCKGTIHNVNPYSADYPIIVEFTGREGGTFRTLLTSDGRSSVNHVDPVCVLIHRPKKKVVKRFYQWAFESREVNGDIMLKPCAAYMTEDFEHLDGRISSYSQNPNNLHKTETFIDLEVEW